MPELVPMLPEILELIEEGKYNQALVKIESMLEINQDIELHRLRLKILLFKFENTAAIAELLIWLKANVTPDELNSLRREVAVQLEAEIDELYEQISTVDVQYPFLRIDEFTPLADDFPAIYVLRAMVNLYIALAQKHDDSLAASQRLNRLRDEIEQYMKDCKKLPGGVRPSFSLDRATWAALEQLNIALALLPTSYRFYAIALKLMGQWHELDGKVEDAMDCYHQAQELNLPVDEYIEAIKTQVTERVLARLLEQIDGLLMVGEYTRAQDLLNHAPAFEGLSDIHVRYGDVAFGLGDFPVAEVSYQSALRTLTIVREDFVDGIELGLLTKLHEQLKALQGVASHRSKRNDATPFTRALPVDDAKHRAMIGLVLTYQAVGRATEAQPLLRELLTWRDLPSEVDHHLVALVDQNEMLMQQEKCDQLRQQAHQYLRDGRLKEALATFYNLCSLPATQSVDKVWLAVAALRAGQPVQILLHVLSDVPTSALASLPREQVYELLDKLCDENQWQVVENYASSLKLAAVWRKKYQARLEAFVQLRIGDLRWLLDEKQFEEADTLASQLLALAPEKEDIQLLRARVHIQRHQLAKAQAILERISDDATIRREATFALAEIDLLRGYYDDARRRLEAVPNTADEQPDGIRATLQNRVHRVPAIFSSLSTSHVAIDSLRRVQRETNSAIFGVSIASVRAGQNLPSSLESCSQFLIAAGQADSAGLNIQYAWRYISSKGRLSITLLCRVEADAKDVAERGAMNLWHTLKSVLPQQNEVFAYEPVTDLNDLRRILSPFQIRWAAEIARKEMTVLKPDGETIYLVYPFSYSKDDLRRTLQLMLEQTEPMLLDIHIAPTTLFPWERGAITEMIDREKTNQIFDVLPQLMETDKSTHDFRQRWVAHFYPEYLERTRTMAFVGQIQLAAQGQVDASLPSLVSMDLFGASDFEILGALSENNLEVVTRNLSEVVPERWIYTDAPDAVSRWRHLFTPDEALAAIQLPSPGTNGLPGLPSLKARVLPVPATFAQEGAVIGESAFPVNGRMVQVTAAIQDRLKHTYIVGRTGSGKSTLIQNLALQDIEAGLGVGVIDPHGDLIEAILERIPPHRAGDVVVFDPSDQQRPVALNILDVEGAFERNMVIADFIGLLQSMFDPNYQGFVGPRFENIVRQSMLALMEVMKGATLIDVVRMLSDKDFREEIIKNVRDPLVLNYWNNVGKQLDSFGWGSAKGEMVDWVMSKFGRFVDDNMMRYIIGQSHNTIDFEAIMNNRQILLVDLSKGKIGPQNSKFLGLLLVPRLLIAAHRRTQLKPDERDPFCLYVDEFQNFTTPSFVEMLSEARKYGMALTMANQFTNQLEPQIREAVFGNVGSLLVFQVGLKDAMVLSPELYPLNTDDIINMPNYYLYAKMLIDSQVMSPFAVHTLADSRIPDLATACMIRETSRLRYGRDIEMVKMQIERRFRGR